MVVGSMAAFPNDVVETHSNHFANLTFNHNALTLLGNSRIKLHSNFSELLGGGIVVSTNTQYVVQAGCLSVAPVAKTSRYSVTPYEGRIYIRAESGSVMVKKTTSSPREISIPEGKTLAITNACRPGERMDFAGVNDTGYKIAMGAAAGAGAGAVCSLPQDISPDKRKRLCTK